MLRILFSLLLTLGLARSQSEKNAPLPSSPPKPAYEITDAYDVYAAVLPKEWKLNGKQAKQLVVAEDTYPVKMCLEPESELAKLVAPAIADYNKQNERIWSLQRKFKTDKPYVLFPRETSTLAVQGWWPRFRDAYPDSGGYFLLSAVGFDPEKSVAVVWMECHCGPLCGHGEFHVLQRIQSEWRPLAWRGSTCFVAY